MLCPPGCAWWHMSYGEHFTWSDSSLLELTAAHCSAPQVGVAMASAAELSFNWMGFISAMVSNLTFGFRAVLSKKCVSSLCTCPGAKLHMAANPIHLLDLACAVSRCRQLMYSVSMITSRNAT